MRLVDLEPEMILYRHKQPVGMKFKCPCCRKVWLPILFLNNPDGSKAAPNDPNDINNNNGNRWSRSGLTWDDLTLSPEISASGHWRGQVIDGECITAA